MKRTTRRTTVAAILTLGLAALAPAAADAIPIRAFQMKEAPDGSQVQISALAYSPPNADSCAARYVIQIIDAEVVVRQRVRRFNVCREDAGTYTVGLISAVFNTANLHGSYTIAVGAGQKVNGADSFHAIFRQRYI